MNMVKLNVTYSVIWSLVSSILNPKNWAKTIFHFRKIKFVIVMLNAVESYGRGLNIPLLFILKRTKTNIFIFYIFITQFKHILESHLFKVAFGITRVNTFFNSNKVHSSLTHFARLGIKDLTLLIYANNTNG